MNVSTARTPCPTSRLIFVNRFYWPDETATGQLLTDLAEALAARGHAVTVVASHPGRPDLPCDEVRCGVRVVRVRSSRGTSTGLTGKATDFATFLCGAMWRLLRITRRGDVIVAMTDPPLLAIGVWFVSAIRAARLLHWVQDIYPELAMVLTGHRWLRLLRPLRNLAWRRADGCVTLGSDMATVLSTAGVSAARITVIPNWAPANIVALPRSAGDALRSEWRLTGKFVVAYSGNLGRVHDLETILEVAGALRDSPEIAVIIMGHGAQRAALEAAAVRLGLPNVSFHPAQPRDQLATTLALGDAHFVTLLPGCEKLVFPSKLYGIAAAGRPVIFIGPTDSEISRLVEQHAFGRAFTKDAVPAIAAMVRHLAGNSADRDRLGNSARRFAAAYGHGHAANRWDALLRAAKAC